ncbi:MAG: hypothetical protein EOP34_09630 [Rickettsiales bacterium]|nr:MAG: hypothetical protein EOP34_09630 [Rickettsiales bacterium]
MTKEQQFNEYQIESIKKKVMLDFDAEKVSKSEKKQKLHLSILNNLDVLIENSLDQGIKFYKINFSEEINNLHLACTEVEDTINFSMAKVSMIEMMYLVIDKNYLGIFNVQCILATRSLANGNILSSINCCLIT